jgi:glycosyltransferase involved in cell wall biosynthesis
MSGAGPADVEPRAALRAGVQLRVAICGVGFASHTRWAEGLAASSAHTVAVRMSPPDKWKWRMQCGAVEFADVCADAEVVLVDGMLDASALAAEVRRAVPGSASPPPTVCVYFHENQLTTPFAPGDRDVARGTHWHYGACSYRSLLAADAAFFNSATQLAQFADALPAMIRQQCPPDAVQWHLDRATELVRTRCSVLPEGLDYSALGDIDGTNNTGGGSDDGSRGGRVHSDDEHPPVVLWNARLEDDKDPSTFFSMLSSLKATGVRFRLVVLGTDPSKGQRWYAKVKSDFAEELLFCGFCESNEEYFGWLRQCDVGAAMPASQQCVGWL